MPEVRRTLDFDRIACLPRRRTCERDAAAWATVFTRELALPGGRMALLPWQGYALAEAADNDGALLVLPVGFGKTLISFLLPVLLDAKRPALIVPAALREKTFADFGTYLPHWRAPRTPARLMTREELAPERGATMLETAAPDLIVIDECDEFANWKSSAVRRIDRYLRAHPETVVVLMTGTLGRKSILNYWHLLLWTHGNKAPVPLTRNEAETWALALDEGRGKDWRFMDPGPLGHDQTSARAWYAARLAETPGVLIVDGDSCDAPLTVRVRCAKEDTRLDAAFETFLKTLETPEGLPVSDPLSRWRLDGQLGCGLYLRWKYPPPDAWRDARRAVAKFVRDRIDETTHARSLTEAQVLRKNATDPAIAAWLAVKDVFKNRTPLLLDVDFDEFPQPPEAWLVAREKAASFVRACVRATGPLDTERQVLSRHADHPLVVAWLAVKDTFDPITEPVWLSTSVIETAREWLAASPEPGIVWTGCVEFGEALATATRLPYYGAKGVNAFGQSLVYADPSRSLVASWYANKRGFNLQAWTRALVIMPPQSAKYAEQVFGRLHRQGQERHVTIDVLATSGGTFDSFDALLGEAGFGRETIGTTQKILRAAIVRDTPPTTATNRFRWARRNHDKRRGAASHLFSLRA